MPELSLIVNVLVALLIYGLVFWGISKIAASIPGVPSFVFTIIQVVAVIFLVIYILKLIGLLAGGLTFPH